MIFIAGVLLPVVAFAAVVVHRLSAQERVASERRLLAATRVLGNSVEREISSTLGTLEALAASDRLDAGNLEAFHVEASRVAATQREWRTVILLSPDGRQLVNTAEQFGVDLPPANELASLERLLETGRPTVGDLARGRKRGNLGFAVRVPVVRNGAIRYALSAVITPEGLGSMLPEQGTADGEWTRTVVDENGFVVWRTREPERFVGTPATGSFMRETAKAEEGLYRDTSLEGAHVYVAYKHVGEGRWTVCVVVPVEVIDGPPRSAMILVMSAGLVVLLASIGGALLLSRQVTRGITSAEAGARMLARGERPTVAPSAVSELNALGEALHSSGELLARREEERDAHLARAELAREVAEAASQIKDEFLITVSHELRTPLNAIVGWAKMLRSGRLDASATPKALETIERNAVLLARLVDDLLDMSRVVNGRLRLETSTVDLGEVVASAFESTRPAADAKNLSMRAAIDSEASVVLGDRHRLEQVVWNLLSNAVKFTPPGGHVEVVVRRLGSEVEILVRDSGVGIKADFLPHVFERFRQADGSTTRRYGGLGLGLAIVRHIVELHGGTVHVESDGDGAGATFVVRLPVRISREPQQTEAATIDAS